MNSLVDLKAKNEEKLKNIFSLYQIRGLKINIEICLKFSFWQMFFEFERKVIANLKKIFNL